VRKRGAAYRIDYTRKSDLGADYHQQSLAKIPNGYCGIGGCGVPFKLAE